MNKTRVATIQFFGGAGTVTGSKHLVDTGTTRLLLDCGLFRGPRDLRRRNWNPPPFEPSKIDAVILSHAHIDHSGYLPVLVQRGFAKGNATMTSPERSDGAWLRKGCLS